MKPTTVRLILSLALSYGWSLWQLDANNAFLHGHINEEVYVTQPPRFINANIPSYVCKLKKSIYNLKQAPQAWYQELRDFLFQVSLVPTQSDMSFFVYNCDGLTTYFLVYVDDLILISNDNVFVSYVIEQLATKFSIKDLRPLSYFLSIEVFLHQHHAFSL